MHGVPGVQPGGKGHQHGCLPIVHGSIGIGLCVQKVACRIRIAHERCEMQESDTLQVFGLMAVACEKPKEPAPQGTAKLACVLPGAREGAQGEFCLDREACLFQKIVQNARIRVHGRKPQAFFRELSALVDGCLYFPAAGSAYGLVQPSCGICHDLYAVCAPVFCWLLRLHLFKGQIRIPWASRKASVRSKSALQGREQEKKRQKWQKICFRYGHVPSCCLRWIHFS